jgi:CheY-like chemotaxis protein
LLDVTKIESGKLVLKRQPTEIVRLIEHTVALNQILAMRKEMTLEFVHPETFPALMIDAAKIEQVLNNLLTNAIKFSQPASRVTVRLIRQDSLALISIQDRGPGIPAEDLNKLFKPFTTTSVKSTAGEKSTGLGLLIVRKIVEGHAGKIWVESEVSQGSTFYVSLPLDDTCLEANIAKAFPAVKLELNPDQRQPLRILLAEDSIVNQKLALQMLKQLGYQADVVVSGQEVLAALQREPYDVILMDMHMSGMGGLEATYRIREQGLGQPPYIIAMTADASDENRSRCREAGMDDYLIKPARLDELNQALQRCRPHVGP